MVKKQALAVLILLMAFAGSSFGLGLGDIKVNSNLNDPLDAEIKIIQLQGLTSGEILPTLASNDDFRRAGVERSFFLSNIQFRVKENSAGEVFITLTTKQVVREPFLNFLVEINWPGGRLLKEYTILLDPPVFDTGLAVDALVVEGSNQATELVTTTVIETAPTEETVSVATSVEPRDDTLAAGEYRVQRNDTLWEIAMKVPARQGYSPQQVMLAIQDLNSEAFLNNNINRVKAGSVLKLPDESQIALRSFQEAIDEVRAQNSGAAPNLRAPTSANSEAQLSATDTTGSALEGAGDEKNPDGYLELSADSNSGISGAGETSEDVQQLLGQLSIAEELNDQYARERDDLSEKVAELEAQIEIMERLLDVQNTDMAQVQQALEQSGEAQTEAAPEADASEQAPATETTTPEAATATPTTPVKATPPAPIKQDFMWYVNEYTGTISNWVMASVTNMAIVGGGLLLILLIPFYLRSKRSGSDQVLSEMTESSNSFAEETDDISADLDEDLLSDVEDDSFEEVEEESEQIDAVMEAEMYMAYQKYDQAEEKLKEAFADYPGRADIGLKLMEVFAETGNASGFNDIESRISMTPAQQEEAEALRAKLPIDQLDSDSSNMLSADSNDDFDLDLSDTLTEGDDSSDLGFELDLGEDDSAEPMLTESSESEDLSFDLNLDSEETESEPLLDNSQAEAESEELSTDLDFSLDLGDLDVDLSSDEGDTLDFSLDEETTSTESDEAEPTSELDFSLDFSEEETSTDDSAFDLNLESEVEAPLELNEELVESDEADGLDLDLSEAEESVPELDMEDELPSLEIEETLSLDDAEDFSLNLDEETNTDVETPVSAGDDDFDIDFSEGETSDDAPNEDPLQQLADSLDSDADLDDDEFDFLSGSDEISTKLDLARAYIEMEDKDGARDILDEVVQEGNDEQKSQAEALIQQL